ncbi:protein-L-isoaspartate O-methyltransferase 1-like isoform X1 [Aristolochia californica]|uniref:protein-L-isoaspartate O-methyltransferase 1-like isoform X1 n=1 Tax=Aristolochia californica TaxID=171875 RepID=UPI0035DE4598
MAQGAILQKSPIDLLLGRDKIACPSKNFLHFGEVKTLRTAACRKKRNLFFSRLMLHQIAREHTGTATRRQAVGLGFCFGSLLFNTFVQLPESASAAADRCFLLAASEAPFMTERFWSKDGIVKNKALVEHLQQYGVIKSSKVAEVMDTVDRGLFVPDGTPAYIDSPMQIGYNATISAPHMHAMCLELLEDHLQPGMHALDIGSGTGYLTACFALMVGPEGCAVGIDHIPELVATSMDNIKRSAAAPLLKEGSLSIHVGDGRQGWPEFAPYDAIHVGAAAPQIPQPLIDQLKPGGRMVIPVGTMFQDLKVVDKKPDGSITIHTETSVRYVPLTSRESQLRD